METRVGKESDDVAGGAAGSRVSRRVCSWRCARDGEGMEGVTRAVFVVVLGPERTTTTKSGGADEPSSRVGKITAFVDDTLD